MWDWRNRIGWLLVFLPIISAPIYGQIEVVQQDGLKVLVEKEEKQILNNYLVFTGGLQYPDWVKVPMVPEDLSPELFRQGNILEAQSSGYFVGLGIINNTTRYFEFGLLADFYQNSVALAHQGYRSTGNWVYEKTRGEDYYTEISMSDVNRISEVFCIRATARLKIPIGPINLWGGITGGTYTSTLRYTERSECSFLNCVNKTVIAPSYQAGVDIIFRNRKKNDLFSISFFADFSSPVVEENFLDMVIEGWSYSNPDGNHIVSPVKLGISLGLR